jgi:hypothetical protein
MKNGAARFGNYQAGISLEVHRDSAVDLPTQPIYLFEFDRCYRIELIQASPLISLDTASYDRW